MAQFAVDAIFLPDSVRHNHRHAFEVVEASSSCCGAGRQVMAAVGGAMTASSCLCVERSAKKEKRRPVAGQCEPCVLLENTLVEIHSATSVASLIVELSYSD